MPPEAMWCMRRRLGSAVARREASRASGGTAMTEELTGIMEMGGAICGGWLTY